MTYRVALVKWGDHDGIADAISQELAALGHVPLCFRFDRPIPSGADIVFSFAPYGRFLQIPRQFAKIPKGTRPIFVHWNTENPPDPNLPWPLVRQIADLRSRVDRLHDSDRRIAHALINHPPLSLLDKHLHRFRYVGEYHYAFHQGLMDLLIESSQVYSEWHRNHGISAIFVPWGTSGSWYADLKLQRDIDVLWFGKRRTRRRSDLIERVRQTLTRLGLRVHIADNIENPFIFGSERTNILNRSKITLNLLTKPYESVLPYRFHVAAGNRSLVVSEPELPHCPMLKPGEHYAVRRAEAITQTILYYLEHEDERRQIVENAYRLVTTELTFNNSVKSIIDLAVKIRAGGS